MERTYKCVLSVCLVAVRLPLMHRRGAHKFPFRYRLRFHKICAYPLRKMGFIWKVCQNANAVATKVDRSLQEGVRDNYAEAAL
jgi:hypothetical protein